MPIDRTPYTILVVEDNPGDYFLIEEYLCERMESPTIVHARTFKEARGVLSEGHKSNEIQLVLLDLRLPDMEGANLIRALKDIAPDLPVVVLTGLSEAKFAIKSLSLGVSDYLFKDDMSATSLYKAILYNIERNRNHVILQRSRKQYSDLFHLSPQPMWVCHSGNGAFHDVNKAAIEHYGYSFDEFCSMTMDDLQAGYPEDSPISESTGSSGLASCLQKHRCRDGSIITVELFVREIDYEDLPGQLVLASDITERLRHIRAIEKQNDRLREIAHMESHMVREPLARILGLVDTLFSDPLSESEKTLLLKNIQVSATEMDLIVRDIVNKTHSMEAE